MSSKKKTWNLENVGDFDISAGSVRSMASGELPATKDELLHWIDNVETWTTDLREQLQKLN